MILNCMEKDLLYALLNRLAALELISESVCRSAQAAIASRVDFPTLLEGLPSAWKEGGCRGSAQSSG